MRTFKHIFKFLLTLPFLAMTYHAFAQKPMISSVDKTIAANEEVITFQGSGFGTSASNLSVTFGSSKGVVSFVSDQFLEVKVPAGALYDKIGISYIPSGLTEYTSQNFLLSFGGNPGFGASRLEGQKDFNAESGLYDLCLCDFDGNKKVDIATANDNANLIALLENTSTGSGLSTLSFNKISVAQTPQILLNTKSIHTVCGDLNGDGKPELVVSEGGATGDRIFIYRNTSTGAGNFTFSVQSIKLAGKKVKRVKIADLDLDGKPEMVVTNKSANNVTILVNQSTPSSITFSASQITLSLPGAASTDGLAVDDLNGDRLPEIITSQFLTATSNIYILKNNSTPGNITISAPTILPLGGTVVNLKVGDLDNDGKPDIAATQLPSSSISVFLNQSNTTTMSFSAPAVIATEARPWGLDFGDLDGDRKTDIVIASLTKNLTILNNESTPGNISFQNSVKATSFINRHVLIGDLDGDAKPDVSFTSVDDNNNGISASKVSVFRNTACQKPEVSPEGTHTICSGFPFQLTTGNNPGSTYQWKNGAATVSSGADAFLNVTASGNYTVTAISEGGTCSLSSSAVSVTVQSGSVAGTATPANNGPICIGSTLVLSVNDVGATEYKWTGPNNYTGTGLSPAPIPGFQLVNAGRYELDVIVGGCIAQQVSTVVEAVALPDFKINAGGSSVVCAPDTKTLTVSPGLSSFSYQWFEQTSGIIAGQTSTTYTATGSGEYYVEARYTANPSCATVQTEVLEIEFATAPTSNFTLPATACRGQIVTFTNTSSVDASVPVTYAWEFGDGSISADINPTHQYLTASSFNVKLTTSYSNGACAHTQTKNLTVLPAPTVNITTPEGQFSFCEDESLVLEVIGPFTSYVWNTSATTPGITVTEAGTYSVYVTTSAGCRVNASQAVTTFERPKVTAESTPTEIAEGQTAQLSASGLVEYLWSPPETLSNSNIANPVATPLTTTVYTVTGTDVNGCSGEATIEVKVRAGSIYEKLVPSRFFSPDNGDEVGKFWRVEKMEDYPACQVTIYDDKGVKVHEAKPYLNTWDGTFKGKKLPDGVYYFIIKCEGEQNSPKTGSITILR